MKAFNCDCGYNDGFDLIHVGPDGDYYLCSCDKIYILTDSLKWKFVNYDSCYYCSKTKDICKCKREPQLVKCENCLDSGVSWEYANQKYCTGLCEMWKR